VVNKVPFLSDDSLALSVGAERYRCWAEMAERAVTEPVLCWLGSLGFLFPTARHGLSGSGCGRQRREKRKGGGSVAEVITEWPYSQLTLFLSIKINFNQYLSDSQHSVHLSQASSIEFSLGLSSGHGLVIEMECPAAFIAASTNRFSYAADASPDSLVALGSGSLVALWDVTARRFLCKPWANCIHVSSDRP
jgi:hypothetical protein